MRKLLEVVKNPSAFDSFDNYIGETNFQDFECLLTRNRDSNVLAESNFETALEMLGGESENVQINRFGHWACGWWESLSVKPNTPQYAIARDIEKSLAGYPVLDEEDWSNREQESADDLWRDCFNERERIEYIRDNRYQFDFADFTDLLAVVRGKYFNGYASELIH